MKNPRLIPLGLAGVLAMQGLAMLFFLMDAAEELSHDPTSLHPVTEGSVALALGFGSFVVGRELLRSLRQARSQSSALAIAAGEFRRVMDEQFDRWKLTKAERAIAVLSLKGLELEKIAAIRGSAPGTIRAQLAKIYGKSGVANRAQLSAVFVEQVMAGEDGPILSDAAPGETPAPAIPPAGAVPEAAQSPGRSA